MRPKNAEESAAAAGIANALGGVAKALGDLAKLLMDSSPITGIDAIIARLKADSRDAKIICLGERHGIPLQERFGARMVSEIDGLTHLFLEGGTIYQPFVDDFMTTGQISRDLIRLLGPATVDYLLILDEARKKGAKIFMTGTSGGEEDRRLFDNVEGEIRRYEENTGKPAKVLVYFGSFHASNFHSDTLGQRQLGNLLKERYGDDNVYLANISSCGLVTYGRPLNVLEEAISAAGLTDSSVGVFDLNNLPFGGVEDTNYELLMRDLWDAVIYIAEDSYPYPSLSVCGLDEYTLEGFINFVQSTKSLRASIRDNDGMLVGFVYVAIRDARQYLIDRMSEPVLVSQCEEILQRVGTRPPIDVDNLTDTDRAILRRFFDGVINAVVSEGRAAGEAGAIGRGEANVAKAGGASAPVVSVRFAERYGFSDTYLGEPGVRLFTFCLPPGVGHTYDVRIIGRSPEYNGPYLNIKNDIAAFGRQANDTLIKIEMPTAIEEIIALLRRSISGDFTARREPIPGEVVFVLVSDTQKELARINIDLYKITVTIPGQPPHIFLTNRVEVSRLERAQKRTPRAPTTRRTPDQISKDRTAIRALLEGRGGPYTVEDLADKANVHHTAVYNDLIAMGLDRHPNLRKRPYRKASAAGEAGAIGHGVANLSPDLSAVANPNQSTEAAKAEAKGASAMAKGEAQGEGEELRRKAAQRVALVIDPDAKRREEVVGILEKDFGFASAIGVGSMEEAMPYAPIADLVINNTSGANPAVQELLGIANSTGIITLGSDLDPAQKRARVAEWFGTQV
jgi:hypothetical protein